MKRRLLELLSAMAWVCVGAGAVALAQAFFPALGP